MTDTLQIGGVSANTLAEVEAGQLAMRARPLPADPVILQGGYYSISVNAPMSNNGAVVSYSNAVVAALQWVSPSTLLRIRRVQVSWGNGAAPTAGVYTFQLFLAYNFYQQYSTGTASLPVVATVTSQLHDTFSSLQTPAGQSTTTPGSIVIINNTGVAGSITLTGAVVTLDPNPIASISVSSPATAGFQTLPPYPLFEATEGEQPIELVAYSGVVLKLTTPNQASAAALSKMDITYSVAEIPMGNV